MTLKSMVDLISQDGGSWVIIFVILSSLIEISPIKINPISAVFNYLIKNFNKDVIERLDSLERKLDNHIKESDIRDIRIRRETILDFGNSCMNGRKHTKEEFDFIISECDKYQKHCKENNIPNGVAEATISEIKRIYVECIRDNSFLKEECANEN